MYYATQSRHLAVLQSPLLRTIAWRRPIGARECVCGVTFESADLDIRGPLKSEGEVWFVGDCEAWKWWQTYSGQTMEIIRAMLASCFRNVRFHE